MFLSVSINFFLSIASTSIAMSIDLGERKVNHPDPHLHISEDEYSSVILLKAFSSVAPVLGDFVRTTMKCRLGDQWMRESACQLRPRTRQTFFSRPEKLEKDIFLITEILLNNLDRVFLERTLDLDGVEHHGVLLQSLAVEIDCVGQTRTVLFHGVKLSIEEVECCLRRLQRLCRRFSLDDKVAVQLEVRNSERCEVDTTPVGFFGPTGGW